MEKLIRFPAKELERVRIKCMQCGDAYAEVPVSGLVNGALICPICGKDLRQRPNVDKDLRQFANGLLALQNQMEIGVEFVLPLNGGDEN
ncbi:MAG TPA: hypothetical protein VJ783_08610 [Pirellulales bacterium]|nr:hypothetical protein [Pirellulales bacterium]